MTLFPKKHPYLPKGCGNCPQRGKMLLARDRPLEQCRVCAELFNQCRKEGEKRLNEWRDNNLPQHRGMPIKGDNFRTGSLLITRQTIKEVKAHSLNFAVRDSLLGIKDGALKYRYIGWSPCKTNPRRQLITLPRRHFSILRSRDCRTHILCQCKGSARLQIRGIVLHPGFLLCGLLAT